VIVKRVIRASSSTRQ